MTSLATIGLVLSTAHINEIEWHEGLLWVATDGGLEVWGDDGHRVGHVAGELPAVRTQAVGWFDGDLVVGTPQGTSRYDFETDQWSDGPRQDVVATLPEGTVTSEGIVLSDGDGTVLRAPSGAEVFTDAVSFQGAVVAGTVGGSVWIYDGDWFERRVAGPIRDVSVVGEEVRIAYGVGAAILDEDWSIELVAVPATAAGPMWGTAAGELVDESGTVMRLPSPITAITGMDESRLAIGTEDGLYLVDDGLSRLTHTDQLCGNFITGITRWKGRLVVSTFDRGACVLREDGWHRIEGLPSEMLNGVLVDKDTLYVATSQGLAAVTEARVEVISAVDESLVRNEPGLHHNSVTGLARGDRLWITDLAGPIAVDNQGRWRRYRYDVWSTSNQRVAACADQAWVATEDAGVSWFNGRRWEHFDSLTGLPDDWIMAVACSERGVGYAGSYQDGVWRHEDGQWVEMSGLPERWVLSLAVDGSSLWAGTMDGLYRWTESGWMSSPKLPDGRVHAIFIDGDSVWVGTENGLAVVALSAS